MGGVHTFFPGIKTVKFTGGLFAQSLHFLLLDLRKINADQSLFSGNVTQNFIIRLTVFAEGFSFDEHGFIFGFIEHQRLIDGNDHGNGVDFTGLFDEFIDIDTLILSSKIYAQAIYELGK